MISYRWQPLEGLDLQSIEVDFQGIDSLHRQWLNFRKEREASNPHAYKAFLEQQYRSWAIETGIIEGIYTLDRGTTLTLVEKGLSVDFIERGSTDREANELIQILKDHQESATFVTDSIRRNTPLSKHYLRELHQLLTRNQHTYTAVDQFGNMVDARLDHGGFKSQPNNPTRPDGSIHEYCPPIQVESEIDRLVGLYNEYDRAGGNHHNLLVAGWLHLRFTQIHPFQDGNGRVARALLTWHLVKNEYLPIVVTRDDRMDYIEALETADAGNLSPFIDLILRLERRMILGALGQPIPVPVPSILSQTLDHISDQVRRRNQDRLAQMRTVNDVARSLQRRATAYLQGHADTISQSLEDAGLSVSCSVDIGGPGDKEHWYRAQIEQTAKQAEHWVNFNESRFFIKLSVDPKDQDGTPRLLFVTSLHHLGRQLTGIMAATAFAETVSSLGYEVAGDEEPFVAYWYYNLDAFTFTWQDDAKAIEVRFLNWIERALSIALRYWSESMS